MLHFTLYFHNKNKQCNNKMIIFLTVGLLVAGTGAGSSELLGLAAPRISDQQAAVVADQQVSDLLLARLVHVLLVVGDQRLADGLANGIDLGHVTAATHAHANVDAGEAVLSEQHHGLLQLHAERRRLDDVKRTSIDLDEATAALAMRNSCGRLLTTKDLHRLERSLLFYRHFSLSI